jgi:hypothetical protein
MAAEQIAQPSKTQARKLVVLVALAWLIWPMGAVGVFSANGILILPSFPIFFVSVFWFYALYFRVWKPITGYSLSTLWSQPWLAYRGATWRMWFGLLSPRWWLGTMRATGWPVAPIATGLLALLAADLCVLIVGVAMTASSPRPS